MTVPGLNNMGRQGTGGAAFEYNDVAELVGHFSAFDADTSTDDTVVSTLTDLVPSGADDLTQSVTADKPKYFTNGMGTGRPGITSAVTDVMAATSSRTVQAIAVAFKLVSGKILWPGGDPTNTDEIFINATTISFDGFGSDTGKYILDGGSLSSALANHTVSLTAGTVYVLWLEWTTAQLIDLLFNRGSPNVNAAGTIGRVLWYSSIPSDADRDATISKLIAEWPK